MDREELKRRIRVDWRSVYPGGEKAFIDAMAMGDEAKVLEVKECARQCMAYERKIHAEIDSGTEEAVKRIASGFQFPKREELASLI